MVGAGQALPSHVRFLSALHPVLSGMELADTAISTPQDNHLLPVLLL